MANQRFMVVVAVTEKNCTGCKSSQISHGDRDKDENQLYWCRRNGKYVTAKQMCAGHRAKA